MKKISSILFLIFIILLYYLLGNSSIILSLSFSMYILFLSLFKSTKIEKKINKTNFLLTLLTVFISGIILAIISYLIGNIINIDKLNIVNIFMSISLTSNIIVRLCANYINNVLKKKINIYDIYFITNTIINMILSILLFKVFKFNTYINIIILYSVSIVLLLLVLPFIIKNNTKDKINLKQIKNIIFSDKKITIFNIIKSSYLYISIIILYFILINKYNYTYNNASILVNNTYFYYIIIIYYIYKLINKYVVIEDNFNNNINKVIKLSLSSCILLFIISTPLSYILFKDNSTILLDLSIGLFFYILYDYLINYLINIKIKDNKIILSLVLGLIIKIIFEIPFINMTYRMGYTLILGSILASILGFIISIIISLILIKNKLKINLLDNFNNLLNIIYENIIYLLVLVVFSFIIKVNTTTYISSLLTILFYIVVTIIFIYIKKKIIKK